MKQTIRILKLFSLVVILGFSACGNANKNTATSNNEQQDSMVMAPVFDADSAYQHIATQVAFGPRVPNMSSHKACGDYLAAKLTEYGAQVTIQEAQLMAFDGTLLNARNIIGVYRPEATARILLCAHWDTRPFADEDEKQHYRTPIDGANDGASGVGVLLEVARQLQQQQPAVGIDIVFFDAEDYGHAHFTGKPYTEHTWCLGSQYWGRIPHTPDYKARYGILLDMVGGKDATFYYEVFSQRTAGAPMKKIWETAQRLGYGKYFISEKGGEITDDHMYVYQYRNIPCVDVIHLDRTSETGFNTTWHTLEDNLEKIDRATLKAVGQTVLQVIYNEK